jgi:hypothetical protein
MWAGGAVPAGACAVQGILRDRGRADADAGSPLQAPSHSHHITDSLAGGGAPSARRRSLRALEGGTPSGGDRALHSGARRPWRVAGQLSGVFPGGDLAHVLLLVGLMLLLLASLKAGDAAGRGPRPPSGDVHR